MHPHLCRAGNPRGDGVALSVQPGMSARPSTVNAGSALAQRCQIVVQKAEVVSDDEGSDDDNEEGDKENYALAFVSILLRL